MYLSLLIFQFKNNVWQAVELWLAEKVILPIENTSGGSLHRSYDLLLRHRLHIVGEVQLSTNLSLLALPGVRTEYLKRVLSHSQVRLHVDRPFSDVVEQTCYTILLLHLIISNIRNIQIA